MNARAGLLLLWATGLGAGCAHGHDATVAAADRAPAEPQAPKTARAAAKLWQGREVALRHSHYFGELYDDNERLLLSPYNFATLYHRVDLKGRPITAGSAHGIVPAGSRAVVESVEFPGPLAFVRRMLNAPTAHVWVHLRLLGEQGAQVSGGHATPRPLIVVLETDVHTPNQLQSAMADLFGEPKTTTSWLSGLRPRVRVAVAHKQVLRGMQQSELVASQGEPWHWLDDATASGAPAKVAWYPQHEAWLVGEEVVEIRRPRAVP